MMLAKISVLSICLQYLIDAGDAQTVLWYSGMDTSGSVSSDWTQTSGVTPDDWWWTDQNAEPCPQSFFCWRLNNNAAISRSASTVGYHHVALAYSFSADGFAGQDECVIEYSADGGAAWTDILRVAQNTAPMVGQTYDFTSVADNIAELTIRLRAVSKGHVCLFSHFTLSAVEITTAPTSAPTETPTANPTSTSPTTSTPTHPPSTQAPSLAPYESPMYGSTYPNEYESYYTEVTLQSAPGEYISEICVAKYSQDWWAGVGSIQVTYSDGTSSIAHGDSGATAQTHTCSTAAFGTCFIGYDVRDSADKIEAVGFTSGDGVVHPLVGYTTYGTLDSYDAGANYLCLTKLHIFYWTAYRRIQFGFDPVILPPTQAPTSGTSSPTSIPTAVTDGPTFSPTAVPSASTTSPTAAPTNTPTSATSSPTASPTEPTTSPTLSAGWTDYFGTLTSSAYGGTAYILAGATGSFVTDVCVDFNYGWSSNHGNSAKIDKMKVTFSDGSVQDKGEDLAGSYYACTTAPLGTCFTELAVRVHPTLVDPYTLQLAASVNDRTTPQWFPEMVYDNCAYCYDDQQQFASFGDHSRCLTRIEYMGDNYYNRCERLAFYFDYVDNLSPMRAPTSNPTSFPTAVPTVPTSNPTAFPTAAPTVSTSNPTVSPTSSTLSPTLPTEQPTLPPTLYPTHEPTAAPSAPPTFATESPTAVPSNSPIKTPTASPTSSTPSPTSVPTNAPSTPTPTLLPTNVPSAAPQRATTVVPESPTAAPQPVTTFLPSKAPSDSPTTLSPTRDPDSVATRRPTAQQVIVSVPVPTPASHNPNNDAVGSGDTQFRSSVGGFRNAASSMGLSSGGFAGVLVGGGILLLLIVVGIVVVVLRRKKRGHGKVDAEDDDMEMIDIRHTVDFEDGDREIETKQSIVADNDDDDDVIQDVNNVKQTMQ